MLIPNCTQGPHSQQTLTAFPPSRTGDGSLLYALNYKSEGLESYMRKMFVLPLAFHSLEELRAAKCQRKYKLLSQNAKLNINSVQCLTFPIPLGPLIVVGVVVGVGVFGVLPPYEGPCRTWTAVQMRQGTPT